MVKQTALTQAAPRMVNRATASQTMEETAGSARASFCWVSAGDHLPAQPAWAGRFCGL